MAMKNRITPPSRWPLDPAERIERGWREIEFASAMSQIMGQCAELDVIAQIAFARVIAAKQEIQP